MTVCEDGTPATRFREDVAADARLYAEIDAHEAVHRRQLASDSLGSCESKFLRATHDPHRLLDLEAEAYCAQAYYAANAEGIDPLRGVQRAAWWLYAFFRGAVTVQDIAEAFGRFCPISNTVP